jgi:hypothetical protein
MVELSLRGIKQAEQSTRARSDLTSARISSSSLFFA